MSGKIFAIFLCSTFAYVYTSDYFEDPTITHCPNYLGLGDLPVGQSKSVDGQCALATCQADGSIVLVSCPEFVVTPPCTRLPGIESAPYPDCCEAPYCPESDN